MPEYLCKIAVFALIFKKVKTSFLLEVMFSFSSFRTSKGKFEQVWEIFGQKWCLKGFDLKKYD